MKKILIMTSIMVLAAPRLWAADENIAAGMFAKVQSGFFYAVTSVVEIPAQTAKGFKKGIDIKRCALCSTTIGTVLGFVRGLSHATGRMLWGGMEIAGFWSANPSDNVGVGIPFDADYPWAEGVQASIFEPTLGEGLKPVFRKLGRGLGDGALGLLEIPGQIKRGRLEGKTFQGVGKGFWFALSREVYGITNAVTFLLPNPVENPGYAYPDEWPWDALGE